MSAKIAKECAAIQRGLGEKVGMTIMSWGMLIAGFAMSFYWGWKLTILLMGVLPLLAFTGIGMAASLESGITAMMRAYAQSAGYAEQALNAIRVVHSYGQENLEQENYKNYLNRAADVQRKMAVSSSCGLSVVYLIIFGFYAYAFFMGGMLRWSPDRFWINDYSGDRYTGGQVIGIIFMVMFGIF